MTWKVDVTGHQNYTRHARHSLAYINISLVRLFHPVATHSALASHRAALWTAIMPSNFTPLGGAGLSGSGRLVRPHVPNQAQLTHHRELSGMNSSPAEMCRICHVS